MLLPRCPERHIPPSWLFHQAVWPECHRAVYRYTQHSWHLVPIQQLPLFYIIEIEIEFNPNGVMRRATKTVVPFAVDKWIVNLF